MNNDSWDDYKVENAKKDEPKVWLTVEEAELVNDVLDRFKNLGGGPFFGRCIRLSKSIKQRIEQAEGKE